MSELINLLTTQTGLSKLNVTQIISNAPNRYKTYRIPKRRGGSRIISQPARELKSLQRILLAEILSKLPVHRSATAYRPGVSIKQNAEFHAENGPIMKFDFEDFFPSIVAKDWVIYCRQKNVFADPNDIEISTNLLFHRQRNGRALKLAIGAPSSPCLSNVLMYEFDEKLCERVGKDKVTYSRYADDLTFSAKRTGFLTRVEHMLRQTIRESANPRLKLNESKTVVATRKYKRFVTGLILTNDNKISLGHNRKRQIQAAVHHYLLGKMEVKEQLRLAGLLAFANDVEPDFLIRLKVKYGIDAFQRLKSVTAPSRFSTPHE